MSRWRCRRRQGPAFVAKPVAFIAAIALLVVAGRAQAIGIGASPAKIFADVPPGVSVEQRVRVTNDSGVPIVFHVRAAEYGPGQTDRPAASTPLPRSMSAVSWLTFHPNEFTVPAKGHAFFTVVVSVPPDAVGGNYALVMVEAVTEIPGAEGVGVGVGMALAIKLFQKTLGRSKPLLEYVGAELRPPSNHERLRARIQLKNTGDVHVRPVAEMAILDANDKLVGRSGTDQIREVLPTEDTLIEVDWGGALRPGSYKALVTVLYEKDGSLVIEQPFTVGGNKAN